MDVNCSLSPFLNGWMALLGVQPNPPKTKCRWCLWFLYRWTCFSLTIFLCIYNAIYFQLNSSNLAVSLSSTKNPPNTFSWNVYIDYFNSIAHSITSHVFLLFVLPKYWNRLQSALQEILNEFNKEMNYSNNKLLAAFPFAKLRKNSIIGVVYTVSLVIKTIIFKLLRPLWYKVLYF